MLPVRLRPVALEELAQAWGWYESRREGLGDEFRACVDVGIAAIARTPLGCAEVRGDARRKVLRRFPYALIYLVEPEHVEVVAIFHTSREPVAWEERVRSRSTGADPSG